MQMTDRKKNEELLIVFADTVVYPRAMMVHLSNTSPTYTAHRHMTTGRCGRSLYQTKTVHNQV